MHNSNSVHFLIIVRQHLTNCFQEKWIGRSGPIAWLPHRIKFVRLIFEDISEALYTPQLIHWTNWKLKTVVNKFEKPGIFESVW